MEMISLVEIYNSLEDEYIIVLVPPGFSLPCINLIPEGVWVNSSEKGLKVRIDSAHTTDGLKHIHIARDKHTKSKNKQVSWNVNGKRHDKKSLDSNFHGLEKAKRAARKALNLPDDIILELYTNVTIAKTIIREMIPRNRNYVILILTALENKNLLFD
ncbi:MAG: hypothetical protein IPL31_05775 [Saprospiraceae bacterium]|nr:hypothetical protein [Saprospiraceae bacterium]